MLYNFKSIILKNFKKWKKRFGKPKKMKNKLNFLDTKKVQKVQIFWVTKNKNGTFWRKKVQKVQRVFFEKKTKMELFELLELFDFFDF